MPDSASSSLTTAAPPEADELALLPPLEGPELSLMETAEPPGPVVEDEPGSVPLVEELTSTVVEDEPGSVPLVADVPGLDAADAEVDPTVDDPEVEESPTDTPDPALSDVSALEASVLLECDAAQAVPEQSEDDADAGPASSRVSVWQMPSRHSLPSEQSLLPRHREVGGSMQEPPASRNKHGSASKRRNDVI